MVKLFPKTPLRYFKMLPRKYMYNSIPAQLAAETHSLGFVNFHNCYHHNNESVMARYSCFPLRWKFAKERCFGTILHFLSLNKPERPIMIIKCLPAGALSILIQKNSSQGHQQTAIQLKENHWCILVHLLNTRESTIMLKMWREKNMLKPIPIHDVTTILSGFL